MRFALILLIVFSLAGCSSKPVDISEATYEDRPHFLVETVNLNYYYDAHGGGFSRILDANGNDWVGFRMEPWGEYPAAAASSFRGLPNLVFGGEDDGAGHPGHERCLSRVADGKILSESLSGQWAWTWEFGKDHAILDVIRTDSSRRYWFLYEGTPGGSFDPGKSYFGSNKGGPEPGGHDYYAGDVLRGDFRWMYAGSFDQDQVFYMLQVKKDSLGDMISFLGNTPEGLDSRDGMTVFGFGRGKGATPLLSGPQKFIIGFYPQAIRDREDHLQLARYLKEKHLKQ